MTNRAVLNALGRHTDPCRPELIEGQAAMRAEEWESAADALERAVLMRPFILRHVLGTAPDEELRYVTNGVGMRAWIRTIADNNRLGASFGTLPPANPRLREIARSIEAEIDDYVRCVFYFAFVHRTDVDVSRYCASRIHFFEQSYADLRAEAFVVRGASARLNRTVSGFLTSERFHVLAFPPGREHVRRFLGAREIVAVHPAIGQSAYFLIGAIGLHVVISPR
ncbi:MAG: hypothetical protein FJX65_16155 [Alphaproteobacteria bacterium]|nr:hypothetical protein [Alphaproteobacteria bacterium]